MMSRIVLLSLLALSSSGCHGNAEASAGPSQPKVHVDTVVATERSVTKTLTLSGTLAADQRTELAANASGRVMKTFVERGQHVTRGEVIARLDSRSASLAAAEAWANVEGAAAQRQSAEADCKRYGPLLAKGAITQQEHDKAAAQCRNTAASLIAAEARAESAAATLQDATIRAPFAGIVGERFVNVGDYVHADTRVVTLLQADTLRLNLTVPEASMGYVREGQTLSFVTVAKPGASFNAVVRFLGKEVRSATRDMVFEATVPNDDHALVAGMFVTVQLATGEEKLAVVPQSAIFQSGTTSTVFVVVDGRLEQRSVHLGAALGDDISIREGVARGDRVVRAPNEKTPDGALVD
jgi:membrane fusion protein (multidrug efflux system)